MGHTDGPGKVEPWGCVFFTEGRDTPIEVELEEDGTVVIEWTEKSDDFWGTQTRRVSFSTDEFDQIVAERQYIREQAAQRTGTA